MSPPEDVRRIARKLPGAIESTDRLVFSVLVKGKPKGFLWSWAERVHPKKARVINESVLAIVVPNLLARDLLQASDPTRFVIDPHYNGYPAVLARLADFEPEELEEMIVEAWRCKAPRDLVDEFDLAR